MMRTSVGLLVAIGALLLPAASAQTLHVDRSLDTDTDEALVPEAEPPIDARSVQVPLALPAPGLSGSGRESGQAPTVGPREEPAKQAAFSRMPPEAQRAATVAGAGAGLTLLLGMLAHALGVPLFSRIQSSRLLDNGVRQRVHDTVAANPGITIKEITGVCGIGWGTAVYHLKRLEAERLVVSERNRQFRRYFKNGGGIVNEAKTAYGELKNPVTERLAQSIVQTPGSCQKDLCERVGISAPVAHKFLSRMAEAGLVSTQREWKLVKYFPTPKLEDLLLVARPAPTMSVDAPVSAVAA